MVAAMQQLTRSLAKVHRKSLRSLDEYITAWLCILMQNVPDAVFRTLADPTRRAIFERLAREGEQTVVGLTRQFDISQPAISKHLALLKLAGLVRGRHEGRLTHYTAEPRGLEPLIDWMAVYGAFWRERFDRLETLLNRMDQ